MIRQRIEAGFEDWARLVVRWRWLVLAISLAFSLGLGSFLPQLRVDNSDEAFLREGDTERARYDRFRELFDRDDRVIVVVEPTRVFDLDVLARVRDLHHEIEEQVPYVAEVQSLVNARNTRGESDELIVEDLMARWPANEAELETLRQRVLANPLLMNVLVTDDLALTAIVIEPYTYSTLVPETDALAGFDSDGDEVPPLTEPESRAMVDALLVLTEQYERPDFKLYLAGGPVVDRALTVTLQRDVAFFMPLAIAVIALLLWSLFRRPSGVLLPVGVVLASMVSTFGVMVLLDIPFSITLNVLPAFLLVVGVSDSVHLMVIVFQRMAGGAPRHEALVGAVGHAGLAVMMTSVTTAAGLMSFVTAELAPIAQLGVIAPIGVLLAMSYTFTLLVALVAVLPLSTKTAPRFDPRNGIPFRLLVRLVEAVSRRPRAVLAGTVLLVAVSLPGLLQVRFSHDALRWFPEDDPMRIAAELIDERFKGAGGLEVLIHTKRVNGLHDPETLRRMQAASEYITSLEVGDRPIHKTISIVDVIREINQALNENDPDFYVLPDDQKLIAQELLLFETSGSDDLNDLTDTEFEIGRITVRMPWIDAMVFPPYIEQIRENVGAILGPHAEIELTGHAVLFTTVFSGLIRSMTRSYVVALIVITPILVLLVGHLKRGIAAMVPNLIPIYLVLCVMGYLDIPLDASTLLMGGVLLGLVVDDTIHFMHKFNLFLAQSGDARLAVRNTIATTGNALLFTSLILCFGFSVFYGSYLYTTAWFGLLLALSAAVAFLADVTVAPALMIVLCERDTAPAAKVGPERELDPPQRQARSA